ncbi:hypothetical protein [Methylomagnum sp.]
MKAEFYVETLQSNLMVAWGWVPERPELKLDISVMVNGDFVGRMRCDRHREDLRDAGRGDGNYAMEFEFTDPIDVNRDEVVVVSQQFGEIFRHTPKRTKSSKSSRAKSSKAASQNVVAVPVIYKDGDDYEITVDQLTEQQIVGWYLKKDAAATVVFSGGAGLLIKVNGAQVAQVEANLIRQDVQKAGEVLQCGFDVSLPAALSAGDRIELCDGVTEKSLLTAHYLSSEEDIQEGEDAQGQDDDTAVAEGDNTAIGESAEESRKTLVSTVESFLDLDFASMRQNLIDDVVVAQQRALLVGELGNASGHDLNNKLIDMLTNIKAEIQYLKAAYIESSRYKDPEFKIKTPEIPKRIRPDVLEVDMRSEITGGNWYHAEPDGRWAGPENYSSILVPALSPGHYDLNIHVVGEIEAGIIKGTLLSINGKDIEVQDRDIAIPGVLKAKFTIAEGYRFPFWALKFRFPKLVSPTKFGVPDQRTLAVRVQSIRFSKVVDA